MTFKAWNFLNSLLYIGWTEQVSNEEFYVDSIRKEFDIQRTIHRDIFL
jgi:hypothetical protein